MIYLITFPWEDEKRAEGRGRTKLFQLWSLGEQALLQRPELAQLASGTQEACQSGWLVVNYLLKQTGISPARAGRAGCIRQNQSQLAGSGTAELQASLHRGVWKADQHISLWDSKVTLACLAIVQQDCRRGQKQNALGKETLTTKATSSPEIPFT